MPTPDHTAGAELIPHNSSHVHLTCAWIRLFDSMMMVPTKVNKVTQKKLGKTSTVGGVMCCQSPSDSAQQEATN